MAKMGPKSQIPIPMTMPICSVILLGFCLTRHGAKFQKDAFLIFWSLESFSSNYSNIWEWEIEGILFVHKWWDIDHCCVCEGFTAEFAPPFPKFSKWPIKSQSVRRLSSVLPCFSSPFLGTDFFSVLGWRWHSSSIIFDIWGIESWEGWALGRRKEGRGSGDLVVEFVLVFDGINHQWNPGTILTGVSL